MEVQRESKFMRALFAVLVFSSVLRLGGRLMGKLGEQAWWSVALTVAAAAAAGAFIWHMYRVYERDKIL